MSGFELQMKVKVTQSCMTLCDPMDYTVHGILQARILEWVALSFSRKSSYPKLVAKESGTDQQRVDLGGNKQCPGPYPGGSLNQGTRGCVQCPGPAMVAAMAQQRNDSMIFTVFLANQCSVVSAYFLSVFCRTSWKFCVLSNIFPIHFFYT